MDNKTLVESYLYGGNLASSTVKAYSSRINQALNAVGNKPINDFTEEDRCKAINAVPSSGRHCVVNFLNWCSPATRENRMLAEKYLETLNFSNRRDPKKSRYDCETIIMRALEAVGNKRVANFTEEDRRKVLDAADLRRKDVQNFLDWCNPITRENHMLIEKYFGTLDFHNYKNPKKSSNEYKASIKRALKAVGNKYVADFTEEDRCKAIDALKASHSGHVVDRFFQWYDSSSANQSSGLICLDSQEASAQDEQMADQDLKPICLDNQETSAQDEQVVDQDLKPICSDEVVDQDLKPICSDEVVDQDLKPICSDEVVDQDLKPICSDEVADRDLRPIRSDEVFDVPSSVFPLLDGVVYAESAVHYKRAVTDDYRSEAEHQISVMDWTRRVDVQARYPELRYIYHIANEIPDGDKMAREDSDRICKKRYKMGVQAGIPDLCLPVARGRYHALYIEMKSLRPGAAPSEVQLHRLKELRECGNAAEICYGDVDAINLIINYLELNSCDSL